MKPATARIVAYFSSLSFGTLTLIAVPLLLLAGAGTAVIVQAAQPPQHLETSSDIDTPRARVDDFSASSSTSSPAASSSSKKTSSPAKSSSPRPSSSPSAAPAPAQPAAPAPVPAGPAPVLPAPLDRKLLDTPDLPVVSPLLKNLGLPLL